MEVPKTITGRRLLLALGLLALLGIGWRLMPHLPNFAPIGAITLLTGTLLTKRHSLLLLLGIMFVTDTLIGFYTGFLWTWAGLALAIPIGWAIRKLPYATKTTIGALSASLVFFVVSNFGVWLTSGMYPPTAAGLISCFVLALPFLGTTLASNVLFGAVLLGLVHYFCQMRTSRFAPAMSKNVATPLHQSSF